VQVPVLQHAAVQNDATWQLTILLTPVPPEQTFVSPCPSMKSSPLLPSMVLTPAPPQTKSFPGPAAIVSLPSLPEMKSSPKLRR
jgi:hypothetical protein